MTVEEKIQLNNFISDLEISLKLARNLKLNPSLKYSLNFDELTAIVTEKMLTYSK